MGPAAPLEALAEAVPALEEPVPVATAVTVPVPAVPAAATRSLHVEAVVPVCVFAFPPKSQAVLALFWF